MPWTKNNVVRVVKLTAGEESKLPVFADKWNRIATSTEPMDKDAVFDGVQRFYEAIGVKRITRRSFRQAESIQAAVNRAGYHYDSTHYEFSRSVERSSWQTRCFLNRSYLPSAITPVEEFMARTVARAPGVWMFASPLPEERGDRRWQHYHSFGQRDAHWLAIADFFATVCGNEYCQKLSGLCLAVASCGVVWLHSNEVICCERPEIAKYDSRGRTHCEDGPAIKYPDGSCIYALNGVQIPKKYIETPADQIDLTEVMEEENSAVRMAIIQKFGFARLLETVHHRIVSQNGGNSLIECTLKPQTKSRWQNVTVRLRLLHLRWRDKTGEKETFLPVPRLMREFRQDAPADVDDCEQVRRWTLGWPKEAIALAET